MTNTCVYIHELIDVIGHNRARYMHHMTANWCPDGRAERDMSCFGVWATVGSTGAWPQVVNLWELDGWSGLAANFEHELVGGGAQDPALAEWWAVAAELRRGGFDRIVVPEAWSPTIGELIGAGVRGGVYAHELVELPVGGARAYLDALGGTGRDVLTRAGLRLVGAFAVAMTTGFEAVAIWALDDWQHWADFERAWDGGALARWRAEVTRLGARVRRTAMVDAPLAPLRTGRQPQVEDRRPLEDL